MRRGGGMRGSSFGGSRQFNRQIMSSRRHHHRSYFGSGGYRRRGYYGRGHGSPFSGFIGLAIFIIFISFFMLGPYAIYIIIFIIVGAVIYRNQNKTRPGPPSSSQPQYVPSSNISQSTVQPVAQQFHQRPKANFCQACGAGLLQGSLFCSECGTKS